MNKAKLKTYAPQARKDFIAAVTARAHRIGLAKKNGSVAIAPAEKNGDFVIIAGQSWPAKISRQRDNLIARIDKEGFSQTMEAVAYTWFNRFAALRYMEIHDYLSHGYRVLSSREGGLPEILNAAPELAQSRELPDLNPQQVIELKLAGDQDGELYRLTLIAQCNALSSVMPFLFERIDNETELLLPDNLLLTDSVIAKLVEAIPEEDWQEVEIIGWLYQFYISEKKDQVIGKVVKSEDIPAATQLFTPNWIVQYLVQNSIGCLWLMANPASTLKSQWPYFIEPAEQTLEVQAQLDRLIKTRMDEDGGSLNPETITVLDPACGSGHILVEAYEVLKAIYLERGYQPRSIPRLILEKNLFGLDIDDRAAQLAGFALLMKARADDRRLLDNPPNLNVLALQESKGLDAEELANHLANFSIQQNDLVGILDTFFHAKTIGSLIQIPHDLNAKLETIYTDLLSATQSGDILSQEAALTLLPFTRQALTLGMLFDVVVANPPYMGGNAMNALLKKFAKNHFPHSKSDLFAISIERFLKYSKLTGFIGLMTPFTWMFLQSYKSIRELFLNIKTLQSLIQPEYHSFFDSAYVPICTFVVKSQYISGYKASFISLEKFYGAELQPLKALEAIKNPECDWLYKERPDEFKSIPGTPIAFTTSSALRKAFSRNEALEKIADIKLGISPGDSARFLRFWHEVSWSKIDLTFDGEGATNYKWYPTNKGGAFRRWFGNCDYVMNWQDNGNEIRNLADNTGRQISRPQNLGFQFRPHVAWTRITPSHISFRYYDGGYLFTDSAVALFFDKDSLYVQGLLNTVIMRLAAQQLNPTLNYQPGDIAKLPVLAENEVLKIHIMQNVERALQIARQDWDTFERSWNFQVNPLLAIRFSAKLSLQTKYRVWVKEANETIAELKQIEEENNRLFIDAFGLEGEITATVPIDQITLTVNPPYRYGRKLADEESRTRFQKDTLQELVSYAIGCMMGRYSLDEPGLIYAHAGNVGFDPGRYNIFPADADGIVPITDELWFEDDAANRIRDFLLTVWNAETLDKNMTWLAESLGQRGNETPIETIRRYIAGSFFKDHLQTYKKRPIYWLFSSGKQGAFQALVYLHRYHESTLARMRAEYVVPLTGKIQSRIEMLEKDAAVAASNTTRSKLNKDIEKLKKKHVELLAYDEKLRHYADLRIQLDLDDGVKVNYGKFGDLLADVKAVTGAASDE